MEETYNHHHHHHHAHAHGVESPSGIFILSIALNAAFVAVEAAVGFWQGSLSLLSDAGHNLGDVFSLLLVLAGFKLAAVHLCMKDPGQDCMDEYGNHPCG